MPRASTTFVEVRMPEVKTPPVRIIGLLLDSQAALIELPVNANYPILEAPGLPTVLRFPPAFPRLYSVVGMEKSTAHAHQEGTESEIMICVAGRATVSLWDHDGQQAVVELVPAAPGEKFKALVVPSDIWHTVRYAPNTVLNVAASCVYDRSYYVEDPAAYFTPEALLRYLADIERLND